MDDSEEKGMGCVCFLSEMEVGQMVATQSSAMHGFALLQSSRLSNHTIERGNNTTAGTRERCETDVCEPPH